MNWKAFPSKLVQLIDIRYMEIMEQFVCGVNDALLWQPFIVYFALPPHRMQKILCFDVDTFIAN